MAEHESGGRTDEVPQAVWANGTQTLSTLLPAGTVLCRCARFALPHPRARGCPPEFRPVDQDEFVDAENAKRGNCLQAVVASLLGLPLSEVPHFVQIEEDGGPLWDQHLREWLAERGWRQQLWIAGCPESAWPGLPFGRYAAVYGPSPRGNGISHIVISKGGVMVHDPHPDRTGITESHGGWWLEPLENADEVRP